MSKLVGESRTLEILRGALERAEGDAAEAVLLGSDRVLTRMANNSVIQNGRVQDARVAFRVVQDGRVGTAFTNDLTPDGLADAAKRARAIAAVSKTDSEFPGFPADGGEAPVPADAFAEETAELSAEAKASALASVFARGKKSDVVIAGSYHSGSREMGVVNSHGLERYFQQTVADSKLFALDGHTSGYSGHLSTSHNDIDFSQLAEVCVEKCLNGRKPQAIEPGDYDVIIEPEAICELLEWMSAIGFSSQSMQDHMSFQYERIGEKVTGDDVTIYDDGFCEAGVGLPTPFDGEGVTKQKVTLLDHGIARGVVWDTRSGAKSGCSSTGHAVLDDSSPDNTAAPGNLVFVPGNETREQLLSKVERGLWVTRFHYVNGLLDPKRALMTGLTRDGTFLIENGKVTKPVQNLRFTDSILDAWSRIDGVTGDLKAVPTWWSSLGAYVAPTVLIRKLHFNGVQKDPTL